MGNMIMDLDNKVSVPNEEELYDLAELFKVFGDSTRIRILYVLFKEEVCVCDIAEELGMTRQAVHYTLKKAESKLEEFDGKLRLVEAYEENQIKANKAIGLLNKLDINDSDRNTIAEIIKELAE